MENVNRFERNNNNHSRIAARGVGLTLLTVSGMAASQQVAAAATISPESPNINVEFSKTETEIKVISDIQPQTSTEWVVSDIHQTPWTISHISAAIQGISQPQALDQILESNPEMVPNLLQMGDSYSLPGVSPKQLNDALKAITWLDAYNRSKDQPVEQPYTVTKDFNSDQIQNTRISSKQQTTKENQTPNTSLNYENDAENLPAIELSTEDQQIIASFGLEPAKAEFLSMAVVSARQVAEDFPINPAVMVGQAIWESGWGEHCPRFNCFGIKAYGDWQGEVQTFRTFEQDSQGNTYYIDDQFKAYNSYQESFADYAEVISKAEHFQDAVANADNWRGYLHGLVNEGEPRYATAVDYEEKIGQTIIDKQLAKLTRTQ